MPKLAPYFGLTRQIRSNNTKSMLLLMGFPVLIAAAVYAFFYFTTPQGPEYETVNDRFMRAIPWITLGVTIWFVIAWFSHGAMIKAATGRHPLVRKDNQRVYNLTENLCISCGMEMPKLYVIDSPALNAFTSGIDQKSYSVTLTTGIIEKLDDEELKGVIAHELTHIRNKDVRLLIISVIFVGILGFAVQLAMRSMFFSSLTRRSGDQSSGAVYLVLILVSFIAFLLTMLFRFALSRKREYMADAGAVELTRNPQGLANALKKISGHHKIEQVTNEDVEQMFIENQPNDSKGFSGFSGLFASHPPIEKRIAFLEQL